MGNCSGKSETDSEKDNENNVVKDNKRSEINNDFSFAPESRNLVITSHNNESDLSNSDLSFMSAGLNRYLQCRKSDISITKQRPISSVMNDNENTNSICSFDPKLYTGSVRSQQRNTCKSLLAHSYTLKSDTAARFIYPRSNFTSPISSPIHYPYSVSKYMDNTSIGQDELAKHSLLLSDDSYNVDDKNTDHISIDTRNNMTPIMDGNFNQMYKDSGHFNGHPNRFPNRLSQGRFSVGSWNQSKFSLKNEESSNGDGRYIAIFDYDLQGNEEISLRKGDQLRVIDTR